MKHKILMADRNSWSASMSRHAWGTQIGKDVLDLQKYLEIFPAFLVQSSVWGLHASVSQHSKPIYNDVINQLPKPLLSLHLQHS